MAYTDVLAKQFYNLAGTAAPQFGASGQEDLGLSSSYFRNLLGDRASQFQAIAPALAASDASAGASRRQLAQKGTRTGGTAAAQQQSEDAQRQQLMTLLFGARGAGATTLGNLGEAKINAMLNALSTGLTSAQSDINSRRAASAQMWSSLIGAAGGVAGAGLGGMALGKALGGGGGGGQLAGALSTLASNQPQPQMMPIPTTLPY